MEKDPSTRAIDRFEIRRRLGAGAMGVVFEAYDRGRDRTVALKTLPNADANALYRFKREFRTLADISHPNLVNLYELFIEPEHCFFTMEVVDGPSFLSYVRPESEIGDLATLAGFASHLDEELGDAETDESNLADALAEGPGRTPAAGPLADDAGGRQIRTLDSRVLDTIAKDDLEAQAIDEADLETDPGSRPQIKLGDDFTLGDSLGGETASDKPVRQLPQPGHLDLPKLRDALRQLALGVAEIHAAGKLHRDLKPSNVLISAEGRVVILDFGLATELQGNERGGDGLTGTAAYMAPEQIDGQGAAASDWYAVGVMLYEALTGRRPFTGSLIQVLMDKRKLDPAPPKHLDPTIPDDLNDLCVRLLSRDPAARPSVGDILESLGATPSSRLSAVAEGTSELVGRERQLGELEAAMASARAGEGVATYVYGPSGTGKTALVRTFIDAQRKDPEVVILSSRCYVHESVPYKALDGIVDRLSRLLINLPEEEARVLLPRDLHSLARLFPVMNTVVEALMDRGVQNRGSFDRLDLRRKAFAALRDLLTRLADRRPVIIYIDDLQWADADSALLLEELLRPPEPPPLLLLATFRSEEIDAQPFLREILAGTGTPTRRAIEVMPLADRQIRALATRLLSDSAEARAFIPTIVREAAGSPFLAEQLATYVLHGDDVGATGVGLGEMLRARIANQPEGAANLLATLAVAAHPLPSQVAAAAAEIDGDERPLVKSLVNARLLRVSGADEQLEMYHDRLRENLSSSLALPEVRRCHRRVAEAMERHGLDDPEALFGHYRGARDSTRAALYADRAATKASEALAFDQAAQFYRYALDLAPAEEKLPEESAHQSRLSKARLERGLGEALANAGRCQEAADAFLRAAELVDAQRALELRRAAAEQLLSSGHLDEGRRVLGEVLAQVGMSLPPSPKRALLSLLTRRVKLKIRGYSFKERPEAEIPADKLHMVDICWAVSTGLSMIDNIRGADFSARGLLLSLDAGEPVRIANTLSMEAAFLASGGGANRERAFTLSRKAIDVATKTGNPAPLAQATMTAAACAYLCGLWREAATYAGEADLMLRERCPGAIWQTATARRFRCGALMYLGELRELTHGLSRSLRDAEARGNLYSDADLKARLFLYWLAADDPEGHRLRLDEIFARWTSHGYHIQHFNALRSLLHGDLYDGMVDRAEHRFAAQLSSLEGSMLLRVQLVRGETHQLKAMLGLASLATGKLPSSKRKATLKSIDRALKALEGEGEPWCLALAGLHRAGYELQRGDDSRASATLERAIAELKGADMGLHAQAGERALGLLLGGDAGAARVAAAEAWMTEQGIRRPDRITQAMAPGLLPLL